MALLRASARSVAELAVEGTLSTRIAAQFAHEVGQRAGPGEVRSWDASLPVLARDLVDAGLGEVEMLVEYRLPLTSKRADAVLAGVHPRTGRPTYVVVELKQWSTATPLPDSDDLVQLAAYGDRPVLHPVAQVSRYCSFLRDFTRSLEADPGAVVGAAYLHNADEAGIAGLRTLAPTQDGRLFGGSQRGAWTDFLQARLAPESGRAAADQLESSAIAPSRQLLALAADEVAKREQFVLLDEQQVAYSLVMRAVRQATGSNHKTAVIVNGGPGSGKSVIALSLLGELARQGRPVIHATGSKAFTETLRRTAGHRNARVRQLFQYFNSFLATEPNSFDVLIADEAHRIRTSSNNRFTSAAKRSERTQVEELMSVARVPVFLLDEHQVVRPGEIGERELLIRGARAQGLEIRTVDLDGQFRSGGSRAYEEWVLRLLGLAPGDPTPWEGDDRFAVRVAGGPAELERELAGHEADGLTARMTAGFCWPWNDARDGRLVADVEIGDWARPWNNKAERRLDDAPPRSLWASEAGGFGRVGCIYTAQGFEYDWNGVIFGPDLVWRDGRLQSDMRATKDSAIKGKTAAQFDANVRNVYKVLLTRGMVGTVITSTDAETRAAFAALMRPADRGADGADVAPATADGVSRSS